MICESLRIWNDPNCERTANATEGIDWDVTRREFSHTMPLTSVQMVSFRNNPMHPDAMSVADRGINYCKSHFQKAWR